jgi:hypothetical protein
MRGTRAAYNLRSHMYDEIEQKCLDKGGVKTVDRCELANPQAGHL